MSSTNVPKQEILEYIENKLKELDKLHNDIKQKILSGDHISDDWRDSERTLLDMYSSKVQSLTEIKYNFDVLCDILHK